VALLHGRPKRGFRLHLLGMRFNPRCPGCGEPFSLRPDPVAYSDWIECQRHPGKQWPGQWSLDLVVPFEACLVRWLRV